MKPTTYALTLYGGVTFDQTALSFAYKVDGVPLDLSGAAIVANCRSSTGETVFSWSTENGQLKSDSVNGMFWPDVSAEQTKLLEQYARQILRNDNGIPVHSLGNWVLDIRHADGRVVRLLQGPVGILKGV